VLVLLESVAGLGEAREWHLRPDSSRPLLTHFPPHRSNVATLNWAVGRPPLGPTRRRALLATMADHPAARSPTRSSASTGEGLRRSPRRHQRHGGLVLVRDTFRWRRVSPLYAEHRRSVESDVADLSGHAAAPPAAASVIVAAALLGSTIDAVDKENAPPTDGTPSEPAQTPAPALATVGKTAIPLSAPPSPVRFIPPTQPPTQPTGEQITAVPLQPSAALDKHPRLRVRVTSSVSTTYAPRSPAT